MVKIRNAVKEDVPAIRQVHILSIQKLGTTHYPDNMVAAWCAGKTPAAYINAMANGERFLVAEENSEIIGFCSYLPRNQEIKAVYVHPSHTRKGIGTKLVNRLEQIIENTGIYRLKLDSSLNAVPFYERLGYKKGTPLKHKLLNGCKIDCISMMKEIKRHRD